MGLARKRGPWTEAGAREAMRARVTAAWHRDEVREPARRRMIDAAKDRHARERMPNWIVRIRGSVGNSDMTLTSLSVGDRMYPADEKSTPRVRDVRIDLTANIGAYAQATIVEDGGRLRTLETKPGDLIGIT